MKYQIRKGCFETNSSSMHSLIMTKKNANIYMTKEEIREEFYLDDDWYKERHKNDKTEKVKIDPYNNDYGRSPFDILSTFTEKLYYAIAEYCGNNYSPETYVEANKKFEEIFVPLIKKLTGCDKVKIRTDYIPFDVYTDVPYEYLEEVERVPYDNIVYNEKWTRDNDEPRYLPLDKNGRPFERFYYKVGKYGEIDHQSNGVLKKFLKETGMSLEDYLVRKDVIVIIDGDEYCTLQTLIDTGLISKDNIVKGTKGGDEY